MGVLQDVEASPFRFAALSGYMSGITALLGVYGWDYCFGSGYFCFFEGISLGLLILGLSQYKKVHFSVYGRNVLFYKGHLHGLHTHLCL